MSSTRVPPTGRSRAAANFFNGFHRSKTLTTGSSVTGVNMATGASRSRTRIEPCFRALRTQAPVLRCSSRIEISFMCDIVTRLSRCRQRRRSSKLILTSLGRSVLISFKTLFLLSLAVDLLWYGPFVEWEVTTTPAGGPWTTHDVTDARWRGWRWRLAHSVYDDPRCVALVTRWVKDECLAYPLASEAVLDDLQRVARVVATPRGRPRRRSNDRARAFVALKASAKPAINAPAMVIQEPTRAETGEFSMITEARIEANSNVVARHHPQEPDMPAKLLKLKD